MPLASLVPAILVLASLQPVAPPPSADIPRLIADLKDDHVKYNAWAAMKNLLQLGAPAVPALSKALESTDGQQRQAAAYVLCVLDQPDPNLDAPYPTRLRARVEPSPSLLRVVLEGLRRDEFPFGISPDGRPQSSAIRNATAGTLYLVRHIDKCETEVVAGLKSDDLQQRFLCAVALGYAGRAAATDAAAEVLIPHLKDNSIRYDATLASGALFRFGPGVVPALDRALVSTRDAQQRAILRLLILDLTDPPRTSDQRRERERLRSTLDGSFGAAARLEFGGFEEAAEGPMTLDARDHPLRAVPAGC